MKNVCLIIMCFWLLAEARSQQLPELKVNNLVKTASIDERFQSYNIEMCEVIGGDFWVPYSKIDSVLKHSDKKGFAALKWKIDPINLYENKLRNLAKALGPAYVRVSGTWANDIYFQNDEQIKSVSPPKGFNNILTRDQWKGVIDFCKATDSRLVTSFAISGGMHDENGRYKTDQVKAIIDYTRSIGGSIYAAEMFNEPTFASHGSAPKSYDAAWYARDFEIFDAFVSTYYPSMLVTGPGSVGEGGVLGSQAISMDIGTDDLMSRLKDKPFEAFTYHFYGGVSKRCGGQQTVESVLSQDWLSKTEIGLEYYKQYRDKYNAGAPIWLNETAEAACGGDPLASTYADVFRYLEQLGRLAQQGVQAVMHNTLARSEYGLLDQDSHDPRPNYWAALLWAKLMGTQVYKGFSLASGVNVFVHDLKGSKKGKSFMIVNAADVAHDFNLPVNAIQYQLTSPEILSQKVFLNGTELKLNANDKVPDIKGKSIKAGKVNLPAHSIMFLTTKK